MLRADQQVTALRSDLSGSIEQSKITCVADPAQFDIQTITFPSTAGATQGDYISFTNAAGATYAVWLDIDANGTAPTGAVYTAATNKLEVDIVTGDTDAQVAGKVLTAISASVTDVTVTNPGSGNTIVLTNDKTGANTLGVPYNSNDGGAGSITIAHTQVGGTSVYNSKYLTLKDGADASFYCWFNVETEGSDPTPGGTAIAVASTANRSANQMAALLTSAINGQAGFYAVQNGSEVFVSTDAEGIVTDIGAGDSGLSVSVVIQGNVGSGYDASASPGSLSVEPSLISAP